jgi:anaerobic selenocysteine-containing dehydrogenase
MHNLPALRRGKSTCTLYLHPTDGARLGLGEGALATVTSRVSSLQVPVTLTDRVMPGVVSLPHGWGHDLAGARLQVAARQPGVNLNRLSDETALDPISGNAVLNAIAVTLAPA